MHKTTQILASCLLLTGLALPAKSSANESFTDRFEFSGFGRIVGGYLDTRDADYEGYSNDVSFSQHSLFALQSDVKINDTLSFSAQLLAHSGSDRESVRVAVFKLRAHPKLAF